MTIHGTLVAARQDGAWRGCLIRGASGSGKSTLALRGMGSGFTLVADDRVIVWLSGGGVFGKAPTPIRGLIEVRGVGIVAAPASLPFCEIVLAVDLVTAPERIPESQTTDVAGAPIPLLYLSQDDPDMLLRLRATLAARRRRL